VTRLDLNLVRVFVAIYEARNLTRAALRLSVTQPTISYGLGKLRDAYADRLFMRGTGGLLPTTLAEQLYDPFVEFLARIDGTLDRRSPFRPKESARRFRLAMSDIGVLFFAPPLLSRFQHTAPNIEVDFVPVSERTGDDLIAGRVDVAIGNLPNLVATTKTAKLFREHYACLLSSEHPLIGEGMTLEEFIAGRHVMVSSPSSGHRLIDEALGALGVSRKIVARVTHFTVLPQLLAKSDLLVILPSRVASLYAGQGGLKMLDLPVPIPQFDVRAHWHPGQAGSSAHRWLVEEVIEALGQL
jgi:DNA-binding transcriptional LysR family regulator